MTKLCGLSLRRFAVLLALVSLNLNPLKAADPLPGEVGWHSVARTSLNSFTGSAFAYGFYSLINGISDSLFNGTPGEATAHFTFRSNVTTFAPLSPNGTQTLVLVPGATFYVYYSPNPKHSWDSPDSFSDSQIIATYQRTPFMLAQAGSLLTETFTAYLVSSTDFEFKGKQYNFKQLLPAITNTNTFDITGQILGAPLFPLAGFDLNLPVAGVGLKVRPPDNYTPRLDPASDNGLAAQPDTIVPRRNRP